MNATDNAPVDSGESVGDGAVDAPLSRPKAVLLFMGSDRDKRRNQGRTSPLMCSGFPRGENTHDFFVLVFAHGMRHQQKDHATNRAYGLPPLLPLLHSVHRTQG
jgi:hypothetical protein